MIPAANGEDSIVRCPKCNYAANLERAETGREAPADPVEAPGKPEVVDTPGATSIEQVSKMLKVSPSQMVKTLIYQADDQPVAVLIRGDHDANEGKIRRALGASELALDDEVTIQNATGAPVGFAGPVGLTCKVIADHDAAAVEEAVVGANSADQHLTGVRRGRDYTPSIVADLRDAVDGDPCPRCDGTMSFVHGIEVGHVFKLGTKYTVALDATFLDEKEQRQPIIMGCYGIGVNRIIAGLAETRHDDNGLIWPMSVAPYEVLVIPLNVTDENVMKEAERVYSELRLAGVDVLMDDRDARPGFKFKDSDLIGIPLRVVIGGKGLKDGVAEVKWRTESDPSMEPLESVVGVVTRLVTEARIATIPNN